MKKYIVLVLTMLFVGLTCFSQEKSNTMKKELNKKFFLKQKNTVSLSPFDFALGQGTVGYERKFGNKNSFFVQSYLQGFIKGKSNGIRDVNHFKIHAEFQYRRYLTYLQLRKKKFPDTKNAFGFYLAPLVAYQYGEQHLKSLEQDYDNGYTSEFEYSENKFYNSLMLGALTGFKFDIIYGKLSIQLNGGFAYKQSWVVHNQTHQNVETYHIMNSGILAYAFTGFVPQVNFTLGYNF